MSRLDKKFYLISEDSARDIIVAAHNEVGFDLKDLGRYERRGIGVLGPEGVQKRNQQKSDAQRKAINARQKERK